MGEIKKEKILIITASEPLQQELNNTLGEDYNIIFVNNSEQAINQLKQNRDITAVLVGIFLIETRGFAFLDYIKRHKDFYDGPILIITDTVSDDVIDKIRDYNIFDYVIRYSHDNLIKTTVRNAVIYYTEKSRLLNYAVEQMYQNLNDMKMLISLLAQIVEFKNTESGQHVENVCLISRMLCKELLEKYLGKYNITDADVEYISWAAALHDIGKQYIPDNILNKPSSLTPEEWEIMRQHTSLGASIIERLSNYKSRKLFSYAHDICLCHHERWDGTGYPKQLMSDEIPIWAQIVSVADCYDALTSDRVYRKAYEHDQAMAMITTIAGSAFNPDIVECLWACASEIKPDNLKEYNVGVTLETVHSLIEEILKIK